MPENDEIREMSHAAIRESFLYAQKHIRGHDTNEFGTSFTVALNTEFDRWLAAVKRETAAQALEAFADTLGVDVSDDDSDELRGYRNGQRQAIQKATERAAALRSGTEGSDRG